MKTTNICTINNGVDVTALHQATPIDRKSIGSDKEKFVTVMVAGFREAKDQDTLIRAVSKLPKERFELWLVGDGARRHHLEALVDSLLLKNRVRFLGIRMDVPNILKAADVVVMSSHWEGFGLAIVEGMATLKPVVASRVDGLTQIVEGYGLLFPHEDAEALAAIILQLHDNKEYYQSVAGRCYERAKQFDISKMVEAYNEIYRKLNIER